jgi:hypothetical protein
MMIVMGSFSTMRDIDRSPAPKFKLHMDVQHSHFHDHLKRVAISEIPQLRHLLQTHGLDS